MLVLPRSWRQAKRLLFAHCSQGRRCVLWGAILWMLGSSTLPAALRGRGKCLYLVNVRNMPSVPEKGAELRTCTPRTISLPLIHFFEHLWGDFHSSHPARNQDPLSTGGQFHSPGCAPDHLENPQLWLHRLRGWNLRIHIFIWIILGNDSLCGILLGH